MSEDKGPPHKEEHYAFSGNGPLAGQPFFTKCSRCGVRKLAVLGVYQKLKDKCKPKGKRSP